jgi:uroporphyrin-III C-methyltransferase
MNELPTSPDPTPQPSPVSADSAPNAAVRVDKTGHKPRSIQLLTAGLILLAGLLLASWWSAHSEVKSLRKEIARRLQAGDSVNNETKLIAKSIQDSSKELMAKVNVLEGKQIEAQSQQVALEQLYEDLASNRDDWALAESEQVLSTASQQLELSGNVRGALIALQNVDARLATSDHPQVPVIRRAIARDIEKLKLLPNVDLTGLALRIDSVIGQVDSMPLMIDEKPTLPASEPRAPRFVQTAPASEANGTKSDWLARADARWQSWSNEMWGEIRQLIRIRNVTTPDALLLSPTEAFYVRENLKLRLLNARLALLSRNETAFRSDLVAAQDVIAKYFDTRAKQTQTAQALLRQVQANNLTIEMPNLSDSLTAVRSHKTRSQ